MAGMYKMLSPIRLHAPQIVLDRVQNERLNEKSAISTLNRSMLHDTHKKTRQQELIAVRYTTQFKNVDNVIKHAAYYIIIMYKIKGATHSMTRA